MLSPLRFLSLSRCRGTLLAASLALGLALAALLPGAAAAQPARVASLRPADAEALFRAENGTLEQATVDGESVLRWRPEAGQSARLALRADHPLFDQLRYYDRLRLSFRVAKGRINAFELRARGHVSGPRQYKVHQYNLAIRTTKRGVWHERDLALNQPFWLPWDKADGYDREMFFRLGATALTADTVIELRDVRLVRSRLYVKPDYQTPITWPRLTRTDEGGARYTIKLPVLNAGTRPTVITPKITSSHERFDVRIEPMESDVKVGRTATFKLTAELSADAIAETQDLYSEPLRVTFSAGDGDGAPAVWDGRLVRPLSKDVRRQALMDADSLRALRELVGRDDSDFAKRIDYRRTIQQAKAFLEKRLVDMPRGHSRVINNYPGQWRPADTMPAAVNEKTGERAFNTPQAARTWKEYLGNAGKAPRALGRAHLWTGETRYAEKAIELFDLFAQHYKHLPWSNQYDPRWFPGTPIQTSSRISTSTSYGTNMYFKWICRLASAVAASDAWSDAQRRRVYENFVLPFAAELTKMDMPISNMSDITNHDLLLMGLAFRDANLVWHATRNEYGIMRRLTGIGPDGFSSEGRPLNYHFAGMSEYVDSIAHLDNAGLDMDYPKQRLLKAVRMPYKRATLWGSVPNSGDSARWQSVRRNAVAGKLAALFPEEHWLVHVGGARTPEAKLHAHRHNLEKKPDAWRGMVTTEPTLFRHAGMAILRQGQTAGEQIMVTLDYGASLFHGGLDRNQFTLAAFGKTYTHGPGSLYNVGSGGMTRRRDPDLTAFIGHGSLSHNVIVVDQKNQQRVIGELVAWSDDPERQVAVSRVNGAYPGVTHVRGVVLTRGIVLMFDQLRADEQHTYDFVYHNFGQLDTGQAETKEVASPLGDTANYAHIKRLRRYAGDGPVTLKWDLRDQHTGDAPSDGDAKANLPAAPGLKLWQGALAGSDAYLGVTGLNNPNTRTVPDDAPTLIRRVSGEKTTFLTVLEPYRADSKIASIQKTGDQGITIELRSGQRIEASLRELIEAHGVSE